MQWQYSFPYSMPFPFAPSQQRVRRNTVRTPTLCIVCFKTDFEIFRSENECNRQWRLNSTGGFQTVAAAETVSYTVTLTLLSLFMLLTLTCAIFCNVFPVFPYSVTAKKVIFCSTEPPGCWHVCLLVSSPPCVPLLDFPW